MCLRDEEPDSQISSDPTAGKLLHLTHFNFIKIFDDYEDFWIIL